MAGRAGRRPRLRSEDLRSHREEGLKRGPGARAVGGMAHRPSGRARMRGEVPPDPGPAVAHSALACGPGDLPVAHNPTEFIAINKLCDLTSYMTLTAARILGQ